ncbi:NAD-P-binding protein [Cubamyces sp. BRFM 1775]|nr:NAD-P-binding protein [Cubamyces sp. BRFM 1775]
MSSALRPTTWLITGASRGIGFEFVRLLLSSPGNLVIAACRRPENATALHTLKKSDRGEGLHVVQMDVSDFDSIRESVESLEPILGELGLDYLINNAGVIAEDTAFTLSPEQLMDILRTNVAGPALVSQVCLPFLEKGARKLILNVSSTGGSITTSCQRVDKEYTSYSLSKAALNMLTVKQRAERPDITAITLDPGWVKTDMGGKEGLLEPEESISGILKIVTSATPADSGKYLRYNGESLPW